MKRMKVAGIVGLCFLLLFVVACRNNSGNTTDTKSGNISSISKGKPEPNTASADKIDYGLFCGDTCKEALTLLASKDSIKGFVGLVASGTFPFGLGTERVAEETVKKHFPNMKLIIGNGNSDPVTQTAVIDDFISKKVDVLVVDLVEKDAVNPALERAKVANIPIILIDRRSPVKVLMLIKADDVEVGRKAGGQVVRLLNGKGTVIEMKGTAASSTTIDRHQGIEEAFDGYPDIKVLESVSADFDQPLGFKVMEEVLQHYPKGKISALISHADVMTMGAIQAIKASGREKEIKVVSVDAQETALDAIESGTIDATVAYPIVMPMGIIAAAKKIAGEAMPEYIELEAPVVTKENVEKFKSKTNY